MDKKKHVDESWKEQAFEEKSEVIDTDAPPLQGSGAGAAVDGAEDGSEAEINFLNYVTSLGFQAMIFMGVIPHPMTDKIEKNLAQAKFLIDTLSMLKEKTVGNLTEQENNLLESSIYELQMKYVELVQEEASSEGEKKE